MLSFNLGAVVPLECIVGFVVASRAAIVDNKKVSRRSGASEMFLVRALLQRTPRACRSSYLSAPRLARLNGNALATNPSNCIVRNSTTCYCARLCSLVSN